MLLNAAYEADGAAQGRMLFLLDEVARLGPMAALEAARDAGRKYGITLLLLYQSAGQLTEQWGREGARAWVDSTAWRLYAAVQDPETARELSQLCGEHGVLATSEGDTRGTSSRWGAAVPASSGRRANRSEIRRPLIKPGELLQDARADEAFVIARGQKPLRCGPVIYFRRPKIVAQVDPSRFQARTGQRRPSERPNFSRGSAAPRRAPSTPGLSRPRLPGCGLRASLARRRELWRRSATKSASGRPAASEPTGAMLRLDDLPAYGDEMGDRAPPIAS